MMQAQRQRRVVRIGPISILTLLVIIALAVLSVLSLVTARSAQAAAGRQDDAIQATYANEASAQEFCGHVDAVLADARAQGADRTQALEAVARQIADCEVDSATGQCNATFSSGTHDLVVSIEVTQDARYRITQWRTASSADTGEQLVLWSGEANG